VTVIIAAMVMSVLAAIVILSVSLIGQRRWETREVAAIAAGILDDINQYGSVEVPVLEDPIWVRVLTRLRRDGCSFEPRPVGGAAGFLVTGPAMKQPRRPPGALGNPKGDT